MFIKYKGTIWIRDTFAGLFCEYLYTGKYVVNASWLHYEEIKEYRFVYKEYNVFAEILELIANIMDGEGANDAERIGEE